MDQTTLPVSSGGLVIQKGPDIALPNVILSLHSVGPFVDAILSYVNALAQTNERQEAVLGWKALHGEELLRSSL